MALFEADILGNPIVSTDVSDPHGFLSKYGGSLVENSKEGIYQGLQMLYEDKVQTLTVDYEKYNRECVAEFERIVEVI